MFRIGILRSSALQQSTSLSRTCALRIMPLRLNSDVAQKRYKPPQSIHVEGSYQNDYERILKYSLIPLSLIPFYTSYMNIPLNPLIDMSIATTFLFYSYYGFKTVIINYLPKERYPKGNFISRWTLYSTTLLAFCGIYQLETENNGFVDLIKRLWNYDERDLYIFGKYD